MATNKVKKHQHVVPRTYLRGWADGQDHVAVLDRGATTPKRFSVSNSAVRTRFYNHARADGAETDVVENWLDKHIESPVADCLKALRAGAEVGDVDKTTLINFTVAQLVRTPTVFAYMSHIDAHQGAMFALMETAKAGELDLLELNDAQRDHYLDIARQAWAKQREGQDSRASRLRTMVRKLDEISNQVTSWHWSVATSLEPGLITGDSPVVTLNPTGFNWAGLIPTGSPLWLPLSPTVLLVGDPVRPLAATSTLNLELVHVVTSALARQADRALFNAPGVDWPSWLAFPPTKPSLPKPTITWRTSTGASTFPTTYPPVASTAVATLLEQLGAVETVE